MRIQYYFAQKIGEDEKEYIQKRIDKFKRTLPKEEYEEDELVFDLRADCMKKGFWQVNVVFETPYGDFRAEKKGPSATVAFDEVEEAIQKQIRRKKGRFLDLKERGSRSLRKKRAINKEARLRKAD